MGGLHDPVRGQGGQSGEEERDERDEDVQRARRLREDPDTHRPEAAENREETDQSVSAREDEITGGQAGEAQEKNADIEDRGRGLDDVAGRVAVGAEVADAVP